MLCYEKVVLLLSVTVKILYLECCVIKRLLYCWFFVRSNNLNSVNNTLINRFFGQIPGQIVLGLFKLISLRSVNSEKPRTICPAIDLKTAYNKIIVL